MRQRSAYGDLETGATRFGDPTCRRSDLPVSDQPGFEPRAKRKLVKVPVCGEVGVAPCRCVRWIYRHARLGNSDCGNTRRVFFHQIVLL